MTIWNEIYKNYKKNGQKWASLKKELNPEFLKLVSKSSFKAKEVLDIGCGDGRYLAYLKNLGFTLTGLDSSPEAIKMSREKLGAEADLICEDMFRFPLPKNKYDFVYSVSAIHHGFKKDISWLIGKIYDSLLQEGIVFITLPNISDLKRWDTFRKNKKLAPGTYSPLSGPELGLAHSFFNKTEIQKMFADFRSLEIKFNENWIITAKK